VIIGAKCSDGIVLVADRKLTNIFDESVRYDNKLFGDLSHITMGYTGTEKIFDIFRKYVVGEVIINRDNEMKRYTFNYLISKISQLVKEFNQILYEPTIIFKLLLARHDYENSILYYINSDGTIERVNYMSIGTGEETANKFCANLNYNDITMNDFTKQAYLSIEYMSQYRPDLKVGIESGNIPTIRFLPFDSMDDRGISSEELKECKIYVDNKLKELKEVFDRIVKD
jgi:20S proteasome alpha/beta subunit